MIYLFHQATEKYLKKNITTDAALSEALNGQRISFAYHSGKIENDSITYHDTREIFEHDGVTSYTGDLRTLFEIRNSRDAHEFFLTAFNEKRSLDEAFIKELQRHIFMRNLRTSIRLQTATGAPEGLP
ncbi:MAG: hypothetical protein K1W23_10955 [Lachnospiraceae bacterium]|jgi:hypothetical protein